MSSKGPISGGRVGRLLIDCTTSGSPGLGHLQRELPAAAARVCPNGWDILVLQGAAAAPTAGITVVDSKRTGHGWVERWKWFNYDLPRHIESHKADVFLSLSGILSNAIGKRCATVSTVNNMLPFSPAVLAALPITSSLRAKYLLLQRAYVRSARLADAMLLHSGLILRKLSEHIDGLEKKALVVHTGSPGTIAFDPDRPSAHPNQGRPYILYLSAMYWYKNHLTLIEAYKRELAKGAVLPELILAGIAHDKSYLDRVVNATNVGELRGQVKYVGALPAETIGAWIHHALVNVFPSTCETNSIVLAETLGVHGVLACSNIEPMPEICGDAAIYFDPYDADAIGAQLVRLCNDAGLRQRLRYQAGVRAEGFSWSACGQAIWSLVDVALANFHRRSPGANMTKPKSHADGDYLTDGV